MGGASLYDVSLIFSVIAFIAAIFSLVQTVHLSLTMTYHDSFRESWNPNEKVREPTWDTKEVKEEVVTWKR